MKQSEIMMSGEGDAWFTRNCDKLGQHDPVSDVIESIGIKPKSVLEIGCANGWRLEKLRNAFACQVYGVEPSLAACMAANVPLFQSTADALPCKPSQFDLVIYGFCLYLSDPVDWFKITQEGDRVLAYGGNIIIHDFDGDVPFARRYEHRSNMMSHHIDFSKFWLAHPFYREVTRLYLPDGEIVSVLKKNATIKVLS